MFSAFDLTEGFRQFWGPKIYSFRRRLNVCVTEQAGVIYMWYVVGPFFCSGPAEQLLSVQLTIAVREGYVLAKFCERQNHEHSFKALSEKRK
jgi:hypothetical protein